MSASVEIDECVAVCAKGKPNEEVPKAGECHAMDIIVPGDSEKEKVEGRSNTERWRWVLNVAGSGSMVALGCSTNILSVRYYFMQGGTHRWLTTWLQVVGWPFILLILLLQGLRGKTDPKTQSQTQTTRLTLRRVAWYSLLGIILACTNFLFTWGSSFLEASTTTVLISTQLAFNSLFSVVIVRQRMTAFTLNAVVLILLSSVLLLCDSREDSHSGARGKNTRLKGFVMTLSGAALNGLLLPLVQQTYKKTDKVTMAVIMEMQMVVCMSASVLCMVGMQAGGDLTAMHDEAKQFHGGAARYVATLLCVGVSSQVLFMGNVALIHLTSALLAAVYTSLLLPVTGLLAVLLFKDEMNGIKGMSLALAVWGFASYAYGGYRLSKTSASSSSSSEEA